MKYFYFLKYFFVLSISPINKIAPPPKAIIIENNIFFTEQHHDCCWLTFLYFLNLKPLPMNQFTKGISIALCCITIIVSGTLISCKKQISSVEETSESKKFEYASNGISVRYLANLTEQELSFNISLRNKEDEVLISENFFVKTLDRTELGKQLTAMITEKAKEIAGRLSIGDIEKLNTVMDEMRDEVRNGKERDELIDLRVQGLFASNSLLKATKRAKQALRNERVKASSVERNIYEEGQNQGLNTVYEGFNREMSNFGFNEDIIINVSELQYYASIVQADASDFFNFIFAQENLSGDITLANLLVKTDRWFPFFSAGHRFNGLGSSWGCCGNYSGYCTHANPVCYIHDYLCQRCGHWLCFPGCRPD